MALRPTLNVTTSTAESFIFAMVFRLHSVAVRCVQAIDKYRAHKQPDKLYRFIVDSILDPRQSYFLPIECTLENDDGKGNDILANVTFSFTNYTIEYTAAVPCSYVDSTGNDRNKIYPTGPADEVVARVLAKILSRLHKRCTKAACDYQGHGSGDRLCQELIDMLTTDPDHIFTPHLVHYPPCTKVINGQNVVIEEVTEAECHSMGGH